MNITENLLYILARLAQRYRRVAKVPVDQMQAGEVERILLISTTAIGDTLLSTPVFTALREEFPRATIKALIRDKFCCLFKDNPDIDGVIPYRPKRIGQLQTLLALRKAHFQMALVLHVSDAPPVLLSILAGIPSIVGHSPRTFLNRFFTLRPHIEPKPHAIDLRMAVVKTLVPQRSTWPHRMVLPLHPDTALKVRSRFSHRLGLIPREVIVGFQPGASKDFKMWPRENFIALGKRLLDLNGKIRVIILGSADETDLGKTIESGIGMSNRALSLCGQIPLNELPYLTAGMQCLVTNDTGTMHIAIAVGTPTVSLFVPTDPAGIGPIQDLEKHIILSKPRPCGAECVTKQCTKTPGCMALLTVDEVFAATQLVLGL